MALTLPFKPATRSRRGVRGLGAASAAAVVLSLAASGVAAATPQAQAGVTRETVAALDPALSAGRGAAVKFAEQEAENAVTDGQIIGPSRAAYTLPAEASGRTAVKLTAGQYVEFTLTRETNAINVRYALPDAPTGGGITAPLAVSLAGRQERTMTLTSQYSWLYNQYAFSNDPNAGPIHPDWWITERDAWFGTGITIPFRPMHFYDEQRLRLGKTYAAGTKLRLTSPSATPAAWTVIDLVDTESVAKPANKPANALSVLDFGADKTGATDAAPAIDAAIAAAKAAGKTVFIPKGTYQVNRHIVVDDVTVQGAGNWYTIIKGHEVTLAAPLPDQSIHTGAGFYGKYMEDGGSSNVHLSGFAIEGDVRERIDTDQVNGIGGALNNSSIDGLYIHHTKVGLWFDGPMHDTNVTNNIVVDQIADGINFRRGVKNSTAANNFFRNTGDDGMAMWSHHAIWETPVPSDAHDEDAGNVFDHNTVQTPTLANGIAIYGGRDNTVSNNVVADPLREGSGLHAGRRFGATAFAGSLKFTNNTVVRSGTFELNWNIGLGAIWFFALEGSLTANIEVTGDHYLDNTYNAIMFVADWPVKDLYSISNVHFKDVHVDGTGTSVVSGRAAGSASFENVDARNVGAVPVNNCGTFHFTAAGSEFSLTDLGGNDGWLARWMLPNTITCDDRPPVVAPPAPSPWS
ncbi:MAG: glycosyl hydrolase family 28-related protein [Actinomycetota bacterium]